MKIFYFIELMQTHYQTVSIKYSIIEYRNIDIKMFHFN